MTISIIPLLQQLGISGNHFESTFQSVRETTCCIFISTVLQRPS